MGRALPKIGLLISFSSSTTKVNAKLIQALAVAAIAALMASATSAQTSPAFNNRDGWALALGSVGTQGPAGRTDETRVALRRYTTHGVVSLEHVSLERAGQSDRALALDAYPKLWEGAYANVAFQASSDAKIFPSQSWRAELFQGLDGGWEVSAGHDRIGFSQAVNIASLGLGRYVGNFYWRARVQKLDSPLTEGQGTRMLVRHYYRGDADSYWELNASQGRSDDLQSLVRMPGRSNVRGAAWNHYFTPTVGVKLHTATALQSGGANQRTRETGLTAIVRW